MFSGFLQQQQNPSDVPSISSLLFSQGQKQLQNIPPLLRARKTLSLKDQDFQDLLHKTRKLGSPSFKTAMKKYLTTRKINHQAQVIIGNGISPTFLSFLTPYVKKITFKQTEPEVYFSAKRTLLRAKIREEKVSKLMQKLKYTKSLNILNSMQKWILDSMRYLTHLKTLVLTSDGHKKTEEHARILKCHKQFNLEELTFNSSSDGFMSIWYLEIMNKMDIFRYHSFLLEVKEYSLGRKNSPKSKNFSADSQKIFTKPTLSDLRFRQLHFLKLF